MSSRQSQHFPEFPSILAMLGAILQRPRSALPASTVRRWCSSWAGCGIILMVLCLAVYRPGLRSIPPVDRDESRFAQASRTMLESGDFVIPRIQNTPRLNKPPLIYWLQSGSAWLLGDAPGPGGLGQWGNGNIWVFRLPSALCAIGTVLLTWRLGLRMFDPRAAALAAAILAVCPMVIWDAHQARADQLLLFTTTGTMFALFICWKNSHKHTRATSEGVARAARLPVVLQQRFLWPATFWIFLSLGILAKGPITPLIAALTIITLCLSTRSFRWLLHLRPVLGLIILTALVGPWVYAVIDRVGWDTYSTVIWKETIGRSTEAAENHWGPPGYHTILLAALFWPGSLLTLAAIINATKQVWRTTIRGPRNNSSPNSKLFLLSWLLPSWLLFECIATKLPHYTMPLYPAVALLSARAVFAASPAQLRDIGSRIGLALWSGVGFFGLSLAIIFVAAAGGIREHVPSYAIWFGAFFLMLLGIMIFLAHRAAARAHLSRAITIAIIAIVSWVQIALGAVLPLSRDLWISGQLAAIVSHAQPSASAPVALIGYQEDSAIFMLRGRAERIQPVHLEDWIAHHPTGFVAIEPARAPDAAEVAAASLTRVSTIDGYNYSIGKRAKIEVYAPRPIPANRP